MTVSIVGDTRFKAIYGRMREMLDWEHRQQYGISIPDVWVLWSEQAVVKVPQQGPTVDCAIYMTAFAEPLANLENANYPTSMEYNSASAAQGHIKIANRLNMVIRSCNLNYQALGIRTPSMMSTKPEHKPSDEVVQQRRMLLILSNSLGCIVFFASPVNPRIFLPASGIAIVQDGILMEWKCAPFFMAEDQKPKGEFVCSQENWKTAASVTLEINQLVPVMWPASRTTFTNRRFPTYIFSSDHSLAAALEAHADQVICYLKGEEPESALTAFKALLYLASVKVPSQSYTDYLCVCVAVGRKFSEVAQYSSVELSLDRGYTHLARFVSSLYEMALFPRLHFIRESSHEAMVYDLVSKIDSTFRTFSTTSPVTHEEQQLLNVGEGVGSSFLWVTYIQHFWPHVDPSVVYEAMKEGKVDWPETESERMWHEHIRYVCFGPSVNIGAWGLVQLIMETHRHALQDCIVKMDILAIPATRILSPPVSVWRYSGTCCEARGYARITALDIRGYRRYDILWVRERLAAAADQTAIFNTTPKDKRLDAFRAKDITIIDAAARPDARALPDVRDSSRDGAGRSQGGNGASYSLSLLHTTTLAYTQVFCRRGRLKFTSTIPLAKKTTLRRTLGYPQLTIVKRSNRAAPLSKVSVITAFRHRAIPCASTSLNKEAIQISAVYAVEATLPFPAGKTLVWLRRSTLQHYVNQSGSAGLS
ncbi:hypothetical protein K438DRAFT_1777941 [Mycena galopus ATCC 62051]|nr:hypothetical protein K438DRAFT_1777941 [Mycena galopus ATCC 62051]